ncbi:MAG: iron-sulfur cluster assembly scaffold protein [Candidatus Eremiobacteraeota bacterium]|nr:iron-sulfur cluster assembly scaffold protein [Candidatus Eremiobacteraeota bacterium]
MNFAKFQQLVEHRTGFRTMDNPTATGEYFSDSCGDLYTFFLKIGPGDVIEDLSYFTTGCGFGTATCSLLVELARGKTIDEALAISDADIEAALDGYPEKKKDYPERSRLALQAAIEDYRKGRASGKITDVMLEEARATVAAASAAASAKGNGTTSEDAKAGPKVFDDAGVVTIKLRG